MTGTQLLPSVLPSQPALQDSTTSPDELKVALALGKVTNPAETAIFICGFKDCFKLFPTRDRVMFHRKKDHDTTDDGQIITWNE